MSIHKKLLITFIVFSGVLIISMALLVKWSFHHNFLAYIKEQNLSRLEEAALRLADYYEDHGNWSSLQNNPRQLRKLLSRPPPSLRPSHPDMASLPDPIPKPMPLFFLLDTEQNLLMGKAPRQIKRDQLIPVMVADTAVGFLGFDLNRRTFTRMDERFAKRQGQQLLLISITGIALSLLFAWPVSHFLVHRLERLGQQIHHLSEGRYEERVALSGKDELTSLGDHLNHLALTLQKTEHSRRKWVADISHELRTPIATLRAQLEAIEDGVHRYNTTSHNRLAKQTLRLQQLVDDLYQLSLADVGALQYRKQNCDIQALIEECLQNYRDQFIQAGLSLTSTLDISPRMRLFADSQRLLQLLSNLLENSLRYTNSPGETRISAIQQQDQLIITVEDSSPGVPEQQLEHLFERFYRGESSRNRETGGAGLGLNICHSIVSAHEGSINARTSELGGLEIRVVLPARHA